MWLMLGDVPDLSDHSGEMEGKDTEDDHAEHTAQYLLVPGNQMEPRVQYHGKPSNCAQPTEHSKHQ